MVSGERYCFLRRAMLCTSASIVLLWVTHVFMFGIYASYAAHDALRTIITAEVVVWFIFTKSLRCWRQSASYRYRYIIFLEGHSVIAYAERCQ